MISENRSRAGAARTGWRIVRWGCGASIATLAALAAVLFAPVMRDPAPGFDARKGRLISVERQSVAREGSSFVTELRLTSDSGLAVDLSVRVPDRSGLPPGGRAALLILGGRNTGRDAARLQSDTGDLVVAALSYPFHGNPDVRVMEAVLSIPRIQRALLDTVPAILLAADFLSEQPFVDAGRLELVGVSLGAFLVSPAGALDGRFRRVWIVHGADRTRDVIEYALRDDIPWDWLRGVVASGLNVLAGGKHLAPARWVGRISPRPVVVINARDDEALPRACIEALHAALGDPHEIIWTQGSHVEPHRRAIIDELGRLVLDRVQ